MYCKHYNSVYTCKCDKFIFYFSFQLRIRVMSQIFIQFTNKTEIYIQMDKEERISIKLG